MQNPTDNCLDIGRDDIIQDALKQPPEPRISTINPGYVQGNVELGYYVKVCSLRSTAERPVLLLCNIGNFWFQHGMTPTEARELAGYLQAEANYCEQFGKEVAA